MIVVRCIVGGLERQAMYACRMDGGVMISQLWQFNTGTWLQQGGRNGVSSGRIHHPFRLKLYNKSLQKAIIIWPSTPMHPSPLLIDIISDRRMKTPTASRNN